MLTQTDSRRRVTLPSSFGIKPGDAIDIEMMEDGRIMLVPVEPVPRHQLWAWTADAKAAITASLADVRPSTVVETASQAAVVVTKWTDEN